MTSRLFKPIESQAIEREIDEEFRFHLESLTHELQKEMPLAEAKDAAVKRFGDVEQIRDQCVAISKRSHPLTRALKSFLVAVFLTGVLVRILSTEMHVMRVGTILIFVAIMGRLFLYVRGLNPSNFRSNSETSSPLKLNDQAQLSISDQQHRNLSPVERLIADK